MKKIGRAAATICGLCCLMLCGFEAQAWSEENTIPQGVTMDGIELSGLTADAAEALIEERVSELCEQEITLIYGADLEDKRVVVTAGQLGLQWTNQEVLEQAAQMGRSGNIVTRFLELEELQQKQMEYPLLLDIDEEVMQATLEEFCVPMDVPALEPYLMRENDEFVIYEGTEGTVLNIDRTRRELAQFLTEDWNRSAAEFTMYVEVDELMWTAETLVQVQDVLGSYSTSYRTSGESRSANVENAASKINAKTLYPGEEFCTKEYMVPFRESNGYQEAHSYSGGRVVESVGGGVCQVSSTLYNAVLYAELEVTDRRNHAMIVSYVPLGADATISEDSNIDFKWLNNTDYPIYVECYTTPDKKVIVNIYGVETRDEDRVISFESETIEVKEAEGEIIYTDASKPAGYIDVQSAHTGYVAKLWKIVTEDGVESRTLVNDSTYRSAPRAATIGTATDNPAVAAAITEILAYGSVDHAKEIVNRIQAGFYDVAVEPDQETEQTVEEVPAE